jgi:hypothetical protein
MRIVFETENYRIVEMPDHHYDIEDLKGDTYNPSTNPDFHPEELLRQEKAFEDLVYHEGVYGYELQTISEVREGEYNWGHEDSCWGFVGQYDARIPRFNHYIITEMKENINEISKKS